MYAHFLSYCRGSLSFRMLCLLKVPVLCRGISLSIFMFDSFGLLQPATEIRSAYDAMVQSDYDTVSEFVCDFVREFRLKERESIGHPCGSAIIDFIKKLTPAVLRYVQDNAPGVWWTDVKHVCKK
ncbi:TPA: hypothetical protein ACH3X1_002930 [Trebouxia sp. C0004]